MEEWGRRDTGTCASLDGRTAREGPAGLAAGACGRRSRRLLLHFRHSSARGRRGVARGLRLAWGSSCGGGGAGRGSVDRRPGELGRGAHAGYGAYLRLGCSLGVPTLVVGRLERKTSSVAQNARERARAATRSTGRLTAVGIRPGRGGHARSYPFDQVATRPTSSSSRPAALHIACGPARPLLSRPTGRPWRSTISLQLSPATKNSSLSSPKSAAET